MISVPGYETLVTHVFRNGDPYLDSDAVFGVRSSLIGDWVRHEAGATPDGNRSETPWYSLDFDFVLNPVAASASDAGRAQRWPYAPRVPTARQTRCRRTAPARAARTQGLSGRGRRPHRLRRSAGEGRGETMIGSLLVLDFPSLDAARALLADEPFTRAEVYASSSVHAFVNLWPQKTAFPTE
jgi:Dioxygenase/YCII-related domain